MQPEQLELTDLFVLECKHYLCVNCMQQHINTQMMSMKAGNLRCADPNCVYEVLLGVLSV